MKNCGLQLLTELRFARRSSSRGRKAIVVAVAAAAGFLLGATGTATAVLC